MASPADAPVDAPPQPDAHAEQHHEGAEKPPVKRSWRRKYRKMRVRFDETMTTSNNLILDEWRSQAVARRLREQNDQILDILLNMNDSARLPANLRVDLREQVDIDAKPTIEDPEVVHQRLNSLRTELANGIITADEYTRRAEDLHNSQTIQLSRSLAGLEAKIPHTAEAPEPPLDGLDLSETAPGYMSPSHEEEYLALLDQAFADPNAFDARPIRLPSSHPAPTEKDLSVRNPDSVYNWLRKHQPQVFLQDKDPQHTENVTEKAAPRANAGARGKRQSAAAGTPGPKTDHEEEDGFDPESGATAKGGRKSKGGDDSAYRPKGGSSRAPKRKREDGEPTGKVNKRKRQSAAAAAA